MVMFSPTHTVSVRNKKITQAMDLTFCQQITASRGAKLRGAGWKRKRKQVVAGAASERFC